MQLFQMAVLYAERITLYFLSFLTVPLDVKEPKGPALKLGKKKRVYQSFILMCNLLPVLTFLDLESDLFKNYCRSWCG